jgi:hypothetical protein
MTHVVITILQEGEDVPYCRSKGYADKAEVCEDAPKIMEYITDHVK